MKFKSFYLLVAMCALACIQAEEAKIAEKDRLYVEPHQIAIQNNLIHVSVGNNWMQTDALYSDASGLYVDSHQIGWTCGRCGHYNTTNLYVCDKCHAPRN